LCVRADIYQRAGLWGGDTVWAAFAATAARGPERTAIVEGDTRLAFREVAARAETVAGGLAALGISPGDVVAVQLPNWWETIVVLLATARLGAVAVPILPIHRAREAGFILRQAAARTVFIPGRFRDCDHRELITALRPELPALTDVIVVRDTPGADLRAFESLAASAPPPAGAPGDVALVMYTSGTTADPKGVLHSHQTLLAEARSLAPVHGLSSGDTVLMPSPLTHVSGLVHALLVPAALHAQAKNPFAGDARMAQLGEYEFRSNCAFCHGLGAQGGGRGPDLTRTPKKHGDSDGELFTTINNGVAGTAMPPNGATQQGVGMTEEEIWQVVTYIRSVEKKPAVLGGDPKRGRELYFGSAACSTCHMFEGKGGRLGPDLSAAGTARSAGYLVESIRDPSRRLAQGLIEAMKEFSEEYETVNVVAADGTKYQGTLLNEDSFTIQFLDTGQQVHSFDKASLRFLEKSRVSLMPAYDEKQLPEKDLEDLLAFFARPGGVK